MMYIPKMPAEIGTDEPRDDVLRTLLSDALNRSSKTHAQIAEELTLHAGQRISKHMLDDWTAESKKRARFPAALIEPLCAVLLDDRLQRHVMGPRLRELVQLGEQVCCMRESGQRLLDLAARFRSHARETKGKRKPTRKA
jgi:hypothetical protein